MEFGLFEKNHPKNHPRKSRQAANHQTYTIGANRFCILDLPAMIALLRKEGLRSCLSSNLNIKRGVGGRHGRQSGRTQNLIVRLHARDLWQDSYTRRSRSFCATICAWCGISRRSMERRRTFGSAITFTKAIGIKSRWSDSFATNSDLPIIDPGFIYAAGTAYRSLRGQDQFARSWHHRRTSFISRRRSRKQRRRGAAARSTAELRFNQTVINHDGSVALCCTVYDRDNMLDIGFLDADSTKSSAANMPIRFAINASSNISNMRLSIS